MVACLEPTFPATESIVTETKGGVQRNFIKVSCTLNSRLNSFIVLPIIHNSASELPNA